MDFSQVCRTCLSNSNLNPIFNNTEESANYSSAILLTTGVKVELDDGLPQNMCVSCIYFLNNSIKFRKRCKDVEAQLLNIKNETDNLENEKLTEEDHSTEIEQLEEYEEVLEDTDKSLTEEEPIDEVTETSFNCLDDDDDDKPLRRLIENTLYEAAEKGQELEKTKKVKFKRNSSETDSEVPYEEVYCTDTKKHRVRCRLCQKILSKRSIDSHIDRCHPGADGRKIKCDLCDNYILKNKLNRHKAMMHGTEQFRCGYCKIEFDDKETLVHHVTNCTAKKKKRNGNISGKMMTECDVCHKTMQKASLRMHKAIKHAGLGPVCEHCGRRFGNKFRLQEHYRAKHGYEKYRCSYCDFQSASTMALRNHERRHRGEKPFVCEQCGAKFHAAYLLAQHRQSHRTQKLAKCDQCPASFKANNSLHMHKLTCHSRRVWRCGECGRAYSCRQYALRHLRQGHRNLPRVRDADAVT